MKKLIGKIGFLLFAGILSCALFACEVMHKVEGGSGSVKPDHFVLFVGWDGVRPDTMEAADTPNIDRLRKSGGFYCTGYVGGNLKAQPADYNPDDLIDPAKPELGKKGPWNPYTAVNLDTTAQHASTMPGWTSMTTGVWADKHGIRRSWDQSADDNWTAVIKDQPELDPVTQLKKAPHFFQRIKTFSTDTYLATMFTYMPWGSKVPVAYDYIYHTLYAESCMPVAVKGVMQKQKNPTVVFTGYDLSDHTGHRHGFSPLRSEVKAYQHKEDQWLGEMLSAIEARPNYSNEYWLVIFTADHGGFDKKDSDGSTIRGDHGGWWDGTSLAFPHDTFEDHKGYAEENRLVPMLIWSNQWKAEDSVDKRFPAGKIEGKDKAETDFKRPIVDLVPTVLEFLGVPADQPDYLELEGESLLQFCPGWNRFDNRFQVQDNSKNCTWSLK
jgi:hypothetical protein